MVIPFKTLIRSVGRLKNHGKQGMNRFLIKSKWISSLHEPEEVRETSTMIGITLGEGSATRNQDIWSNTVLEEVRLSAYPLALWFASSWWRLRWGPLPLGSEPTTSWRMAHEMAAAGYGYVWPQIVFASDGDTIQIASIQSKPESKEPVHYLANRLVSIDAKTFEREIDTFINSTSACLTARLGRETDLHTLWGEVKEERRDSNLANERSLEAMLGFDPDECPGDILDLFKRLMPEAGISAVSEIAPACATEDPERSIRDILQIAETGDIVGNVNKALKSGGYKVDSSMLAWECGWHLARRARSELGLNSSPISDDILCDLVGLPKEKVMTLDAQPSRRPIGLAVRNGTASNFKHIFRKRHPTGRRFELARFICEYLATGASDRWLPSTDAKTARQKIQRSFAAEFLCPIDAIKSFVGGDYSDDAIEDAASYFSVAPLAIQTQLVNNKLLPASTINDFGWFAKYFETQVAAS